MNLQNTHHDSRDEEALKMKHLKRKREAGAQKLFKFKTKGLKWWQIDPQQTMLSKHFNALNNSFSKIYSVKDSKLYITNTHSNRLERIVTFPQKMCLETPYKLLLTADQQFIIYISIDYKSNLSSILCFDLMDEQFKNKLISDIVSSARLGFGSQQDSLFLLRHKLLTLEVLNIEVRTLKVRVICSDFKLFTFNGSSFWEPMAVLAPKRKCFVRFWASTSVQMGSIISKKLSTNDDYKNIKLIKLMKNQTASSYCCSISNYKHKKILIRAKIPKEKDMDIQDFELDEIGKLKVVKFSVVKENQTEEFYFDLSKRMKTEKSKNNFFYLDTTKLDCDEDAIFMQREIKLDLYLRKFQILNFCMNWEEFECEAENIAEATEKNSPGSGRRERFGSNKQRSLKFQNNFVDQGRKKGPAGRGGGNTTLHRDQALGGKGASASPNLSRNGYRVRRRSSVMRTRGNSLASPQSRLARDQTAGKGGFGQEVMKANRRIRRLERDDSPSINSSRLQEVTRRGSRRKNARIEDGSGSDRLILPQLSKSPKGSFVGNRRDSGQGKRALFNFDKKGDKQSPTHNSLHQGLILPQLGRSKPPRGSTTFESTEISEANLDEGQDGEGAKNPNFFQKRKRQKPSPQKVGIGQKSPGDRAEDTQQLLEELKEEGEEYEGENDGQGQNENNMDGQNTGDKEDEADKQQEQLNNNKTSSSTPQEKLKKHSSKDRHLHSRYEIEMKSTILLFIRSIKEPKFEVYDLTNHQVIAKFTYDERLEKEREYLSITLRGGNILILIDPDTPNKISLFNFLKLSMNSLIFKNSKKYKKLFITRLEKFNNSQTFWAELKKFPLENGGNQNFFNLGYVRLDENLRILQKIDLGRKINFLEKLENKGCYVVASKNELMTINFSKSKVQGIMKHSRNIRSMTVTKNYKILIQLIENRMNMVKIINPKKWSIKEIFDFPYKLKDLRQDEGIIKYTPVYNNIILRQENQLTLLKFGVEQLNTKSFDFDFRWEICSDLKHVFILNVKESILESLDLNNFRVTSKCRIQDDSLLKNADLFFSFGFCLGKSYFLRSHKTEFFSLVDNSVKRFSYESLIKRTILHDDFKTYSVKKRILELIKFSPETDLILTTVLDAYDLLMKRGDHGLANKVKKRLNLGE